MAGRDAQRVIALLEASAAADGVCSLDAADARALLGYVGELQLYCLRAMSDRLASRRLAEIRERVAAAGGDRGQLRVAEWAIDVRWLLDRLKEAGDPLV